MSNESPDPDILTIPPLLARDITSDIGVSLRSELGINMAKNVKTKNAITAKNKPVRTYWETGRFGDGDGFFGIVL